MCGNGDNIVIDIVFYLILLERFVKLKYPESYVIFIVHMNAYQRVTSDRILPLILKISDNNCEFKMHKKFIEIERDVVVVFLEIGHG